jgi:hypothetical protein
VGLGRGGRTAPPNLISPHACAHGSPCRAQPPIRTKRAERERSRCAVYSIQWASEAGRACGVDASAPRSGRCRERSQQRVRKVSLRHSGHRQECPRATRIARPFVLLSGRRKPGIPDWRRHRWQRSGCLSGEPAAQAFARHPTGRDHRTRSSNRRVASGARRSGRAKHNLHTARSGQAPSLAQRRTVTSRNSWESTRKVRGSGSRGRGPGFQRA